MNNFDVLNFKLNPTMPNQCVLSPRNSNTSTSTWGSAYKPEATPLELFVSGRKGYNETMNGLYRRGAEHDGKVHYKHTERNFVIRWCPAKASWFFDWRGLKSDTTASGALDDDVDCPHLSSKVWKVFDGKKWILDKNLKIQDSTECFNKPKLEINSFSEGGEENMI